MTVDPPNLAKIRTTSGADSDLEKGVNIPSFGPQSPDVTHPRTNSKEAPLSQTAGATQTKSNNNLIDSLLEERLTQRAEFKKDVLLSVLTVIFMGLIFGWLMNKARVFEPKVIRDQFKFTRFIMLKMFIAAAGTSSFTITIGYYLSRQSWECTRVKNRGATNLWGTMIGALLLGAGMALSGACPGMVWIQVGAGTNNSLITLAGCFVGAFIFGIIHPFIAKLFAKQHFPDFFDEWIKLPYPLLAIFCGTAMIAMAVLFEYLFPWKSELTEAQRLQVNNCNIFDCEAWNPVVCGVGVGLLQIPCLFVLGNTLGSSSCYVAITGQWLRCGCVKDAIKTQFKHFKDQLNRWWQVTYIITALFGSYLAMVATAGAWDYHYSGKNAIAGVSPIDSFFGGFLMVFGARLAKGCTSGHGLSGTALMTVSSFLSVGGMFLGGFLFMLAYMYI